MTEMPAKLEERDHPEEEESSQLDSFTEENSGETTTTFADLGLSSELMEALGEKGWTLPTEIQEKSLPFSLKGKDLAGFAQTGTGKTGAFLITFAEKFLHSKKEGSQRRKAPLALIICPTRELAVQIEEEARDILGSLQVRTLAVYGGCSIEPQIEALKKGVDLVVATPGRLLDLENQGALKLKQLELFICDEVDRMFDMGFSKEVDSILSKLPKEIQKLAFSATTDDRSKELCERHLNKPEFVSLNQLELTPEAIKQHMIICENEQKIKLLMSLLTKHDPQCAIVFTNTKLVAAWLLLKLEKNHFNAKMISGDLAQNKRTKLISDIKNGQIKILIATDVASRGLHIPGVTHVYNFDLPDDPSNYVHRIGRTARAGASGESYSFICEDYGHNFENIFKLLGDKLPKASRLDPSSLSDVEDLAKLPYGEPSETPTPFYREERSFQPRENRWDRNRPRTDRGPRSSSETRHSSQNFSKSNSRKPRFEKASEKSKQDQGSFKTKNRKYSSKRKPHSSHSRKSGKKKGILGRLFGGLLGHSKKS